MSGKATSLLTDVQVEAIIDGVTKGAFSTILANDDGIVATLSVGQKEVFRIDLSAQSITWEGKVAYVVPPAKWWKPSPGLRLMDRLEAAVREQHLLGGTPALSTNLITGSEISVIIDAINAMIFRIERDRSWHVLSYEGREVLRIDLHAGKVGLTGLSGINEPVYTFSDEPTSWFWAGTDRKLLQALRAAITFYEATMHRVRMVDYRSMFGNQMQKVIVGIAKAMDEAEAEARLIERIDRSATHNLHPAVANLIQSDLEAGEQQAQDDHE